MDNLKKYQHLTPTDFFRLRAELQFIQEDCERMINHISGHQKYLGSEMPTKIRHDAIDHLHNERWADDLQHNLINFGKNPIWKSLIGA